MCSSPFATRTKTCRCARPCRRHSSMRLVPASQMARAWCCTQGLPGTSAMVLSHSTPKRYATVGVGDLLARIEALKEALAAEGLFDPDRKVPLPFVPRLVGLICANQGDAEHDVVENAQRRWPGVRFEIRRVTVQGARCVPETTAAIRELDANPDVDVIVVARGGGSFEDLLAIQRRDLAPGGRRMRHATCERDRPREGLAAARPGRGLPRVNAHGRGQSASCPTLPRNSQASPGRGKRWRGPS